MELITVILTCLYDNAVVLFLDKLATTNESVLGYHYPFYKIMLECIGVGEPLYIGVVNKNGELVALLPGFLKTTEIGTVYSSLPFFGPNAGILCDYNRPDVEDIHKCIFDFLYKHLQQYNMIAASVYMPFKREDLVTLYDKFNRDSIKIEKFTNYISLPEFKLDASLAYDMRKAEKSGVTIRSTIETGDIDKIYDMYIKNCVDYCIPPKPKKCVAYLIEEGKNNPNIKTYIASVDDKIIAALIMIYAGSTASYYLPCSLHEYRAFQPSSFLINHAIKEAVSRSIKYWNFESSPSKDSGVYRFKKKWKSIDGNYKIYLKTYKEKEFFSSLGKEKISELFPYFFVYPFSKLESLIEA